MKKSQSMKIGKRLTAFLLSIAMILGNVQIAWASSPQALQTESLLEETSESDAPDVEESVEMEETDFEALTEEAAEAGSEESAEAEPEESAEAEPEESVEAEPEESVEAEPEESAEAEPEEPTETEPEDAAGESLKESGENGAETSEESNVAESEESEGMAASEEESAKTEEISAEEKFLTSEEAEAGAAEEEESEYTVLLDGDTADVKITENGMVKWFRFTPEASGIYKLQSLGDYDTFAAVYADPAGEALAENDDLSDDDSNFSLRCALEKDTDYYFAVQMNYTHVTGEFQISLNYENKAIDTIGFAKMPQTVYYRELGGSISYSGMSLDVSYTDGTSEELSVYSTSPLTGARMAVDYDVEWESGRMAVGTYPMKVTYLEAELFLELQVKSAEDMEAISCEEIMEGTADFTEYRKFTAPENGYYEFETASENGYVNIGLCDMEGRGLDSVRFDSYPASGKYFCAESVYLNAGDSCAAVIYENSGNAYTLQVKAAESLSEGTPASGTGYGFRLFRFVPTASEIYAVKFSVMESGYNANYFRIWEENGEYLSTSSSSQRIPVTDEDGNVRYMYTFTNECMLTEGQTYYMQAGFFGDETGWELTADRLASGALTLGTAASGTLNGEDVYYTFLAPESGYYRFALESASYSSIDVQKNGFSYWDSYSSSHWEDEASHYDSVGWLEAGERCTVIVYSYNEEVPYTLIVSDVPAVQSIAVAALPEKTEYSRTSNVSMQGLKISVAYEDGQSEILAYNGYSPVTGQDFNWDSSDLWDNVGLIVGVHEIPIRYLDAAASFEITVLGEDTGSFPALTAGTPATGSGYSEIAYSFTAPESGFYELTSRAEQSYLSLYLYDENWGEISFCSDRHIEDEEYRFGRTAWLEKDKTYAVMGTAYASNGAYALEIAESAMPVLTEGEASAYTSDADVQFVYGFIPERTGSYTFRLTAEESFSGYTKVFDQNGELDNLDGGSLADGYGWESYASLKAGEAYIIANQCWDSDVSCTAGVNLDAGIEEAIALAPGMEPVEVNIETPGGMQWFTYTPEESGTYRIYSTGNEDSYVELYENGRLRWLASNDDGGSGNNFGMSYELEAGTVYYYKTRMYSASTTGTFQVHFERKKTAASLTISAYPKTDYYEAFDSSLDYSGLAIEAVYDDGSSETLSYGFVSGLTGEYMTVDAEEGTYEETASARRLVAGSHTVTVSYMGQTAEFTVEVKGLENLPVMTEGEPVSGSWNGGNGVYLYYRFTAPESGMYVFRGVQNNTDLNVSVLNAGGTQISKNSSSNSFYDSASDSYQYYSSSLAELEAGVDYYVRGYTYGTDAYTYSLSAEKEKALGMDAALEGTTLRGYDFAEFRVEEAGYYSFSADVTSEGSSGYMTLGFYNRTGDGWLYGISGNTSASSNGQYQYQYRYGLYLEPGIYDIQMWNSYEGNSYRLAGAHAERLELQHPVENTSDASVNRYYSFTAPDDGAYTFALQTVGNYYGGSLYIYNKNRSCIASGNYSSEQVNGTYVYTWNAGASLEAGETYLVQMKAAEGYEYTLSVGNAPSVSAVEFLQYPQQIYYYKVDKVTKDADLSQGSIISVTYADGQTEELSENSVSSVTGLKYAIRLPEDAKYNSSGYLMIGTYQASLEYLDKTMPVSITVKAVSDMAVLTLDENGQGSYSGITENKCGYGYVRFTAPSDGFYNLTLSVDRSERISYEKICNAAYKSMSTYNKTVSTTDSRYLSNAMVYVRKGQSCYIKYRKTDTAGKGTDGSFTLSVDKASDQSITPIVCGQEYEAAITTAGNSQWFSFTPEETGTYILSSHSTQFDTYASVYTSPDASSALGSNDDGGNATNFLLAYEMTAGKTYYYQCRMYGSGTTGTYPIRLVKASDAVSLELLTEGQIYCSNLPDYIDNSFADLQFLATYADGTTETLDYGYAGGSYISLQGTSLSYTVPEWEYDEEGSIVEKTYPVVFTYMGIETSVNVLACSITGLDEAEGTVSSTIEAGKYVYYKYTPAEDGYYRFTASGSSYANLSLYDIYMHELDSAYSNSYWDASEYNLVRVYALEGGQSYCLRLGNSSSAGMEVSCTMEKLSPAADIEIIRYPQTEYYLGVDHQYSIDGLAIQVTYEDGTTETVEAGGRSASTGLALSVQLDGNADGNMYLGSTGNKTVRVSYMTAEAAYGIMVTSNENVPEITMAASYEGTLASARDYVYVKFVAEESGYYQLGLTGAEGAVPYISSIQNSSYTELDTFGGNYHGDLIEVGSSQTRTKLVYLLEGKTYFLKGYLTEDGEQTAGSYKVSVQRLADLKDGAKSGTLGSYETDLYQFTVTETGYYQFTVDAAGSTEMRLYNSSFHTVLLTEGTRNNRSYYAAKLRADTIYLAACTSKTSEDNAYTMRASQKAEVTGITLLEQPEKTVYYAQFENTIIPDGLSIRIAYEDGTTEDLAYGAQSSWGVSMSLDTSGIGTDGNGHFLVGTQTVVCSYLDQTAEFTIQVENLDPEKIQQLGTDSWAEIDLAAGESAFYAFTPENTVEYHFYTKGTAATRGSIYDNSFKLLYSSSGTSASANFSIQETLTAGETYILRIRGLSSKEALSTSVKMHDTTAWTEVTGINLKESQIVLSEIGSTAQLHAELYPEDAERTGVIWSIADEAIASISQSGLVTAKAEGSTTATVTAEDGGYTAECRIVVDMENPVIDEVYPADNSILGPTARTLWIYSHDNEGVDNVKVEYRKNGDTEYASFVLSDKDEDNEQSSVNLADLPLDGFAHGDKVEVRFTAIDNGGRTSEPVIRTYTIDKEAPAVTNAAAVQNTETLAVDVTWTGGQEEDISSYAVYRKVSTADDSTYHYLGSETGYVNVADYIFCDTTVENKEAVYTYKIVASDKRGNSAETIISDVTVVRVNQAPELNLNCASTMVSGREYHFDLSSSGDDGYIVSYRIDFGDGSAAETGGTSDTSYYHTYTLDGTEERTYTVTVTAEDNEGLTSAFEKTIRVVDLSTVGMLTVSVVDTDGIPLANVPVYFNMGEEGQVITNTDLEGRSEFTDVPGFYAVGAYVSGYLPVKENVELVQGELTELTLTLEEKSLVEGTFETHRMTLDEIKDAGIDIDYVSNPENYHVLQYNVTLEYATINFYYAGGQVIMGDGGISGGSRWIPTVINDEIVVILEIPIGVSILKEFYSAKLHILNNASEEFSLLDNHVKLNVPDGLTVIEEGGGIPAEVTIDEIPGQSEKVVEWILRGDKSGEYYLSADYAGILSEFGTPVTAAFTSDEPLKVYGVDNLGVTLQIPDSFTNGEFYYNLIMENTGEQGDNAADMYLPGLNGAGELIQTKYHREDETDVCISQMPEVLHATERVERFYRITDQIYEQLKEYPNYEDFVFYFRRMWVKEISSYGVPLNVEILPADELAAIYDQYRAVPPTVSALEATDAEYGYSIGDAVVSVEGTPASNAEYTLSYEWYDTNYDLQSTDQIYQIPAGLTPGSYHYHCVVIATRNDNGNMAQSEMNDVVLTITPKTSGLIWSGDTDLIYSGEPVNVTAELADLLPGDTCTVTVEGGAEKDAGIHTASAAALSNGNYALPEDVSHEYVIAPKEIGLKWSGTETRVYDGLESNVMAEALELVEGDTCNVTVENGNAVHAGTYTAIAVGTDNTNYTLPEEAAQQYVIEKAVLHAAYAGETIYYGTTPALETEVTGFAGSDTADTAQNYTAPEVTGSIPTEVGTHALAPSGGSADDYTFDYAEGSLVIERREAAEGTDGQYLVSGPQGENGWYVGDVSIAPNSGYVIGDSESVFGSESVVLNEDTSDGTRIFYIKNAETGEIYYASTLDYKLDTEKPEIGTVSYEAAGDTVLESLIRVLSFGIFCKEGIKVHVPVNDMISGAASLVYQIGSGEETTVSAADGTASFLIPIGTDAAEITCYGVDNAGNTGGKTTLAYENQTVWVVDAGAPEIGSFDTVPKANAAGWYHCDVTVTAEASDDTGLYRIRYQVGSQEAVTVTENEEVKYGADAESFERASSYSFLQVIDEEGITDVRFSAEDNAGNITEETVTVKLDKTAPVIGDVSAVPDNGGHQTVTFRASDELSKIDPASVKVICGETALDVSAGEEDGTFVFTTAGKGTYEIQAADYAGNTAETELTVYAICFDTQGGESLADKDIIEGSAYGTLPEPIRGGYLFDGWKNGEADVDGSIIAGAEDVTLTAGWTLVPAESPSVTAPASASAVYGSAVLTVQAAADTGAEYDLRYAWYHLHDDGTETLLATTEAASYQLPAATAVGTYSYRCEVTAVRKDNHASAAASVFTKLVIGQREAVLTWNNAGSRTYSGTASNVTASVGNLISGDTCAVTVTGGTGKNAGTYTAKAVALSNGNYKLPAKTEQSYTIAKKAVSLIWSGYGSRTYDGAASAVTAKVSGLASGDTCTVTVTGGSGVNVGTYTAKATGLSNSNYQLSGNLTQSYSIVKKSIGSGVKVASIPNQAYTGKKLKPALTITYGGLSLKQGTDYTVSFKNNTKKGKATVTITGVGNYSGSLKKTFKIVNNIKKATVSKISAQTYKGSALKPSVKLTYEKKTLKKGKDYTVSYKNNVNKGTATITITGKGNFAGTVKKTFKIQAKSIAKVKVSSISAQKYTGKAIKPSVTVKDGSKKLKAGKDYTITYSKNKKPGTATVKIKGKGNYTGTKTITFKIVKK